MGHAKDLIRCEAGSLDGFVQAPEGLARPPGDRLGNEPTWADTAPPGLGPCAQ
jgi:hypothetical protein